MNRIGYVANLWIFSRSFRYSHWPCSSESRPRPRQSCYFLWYLSRDDQKPSNFGWPLWLTTLTDHYGWTNKRMPMLGLSIELLTKALFSLIESCCFLADSTGSTRDQPVNFGSPCGRQPQLASLWFNHGLSTDRSVKASREWEHVWKWPETSLFIVSGRNFER